jgi:hypothetical protein
MFQLQFRKSDRFWLASAATLMLMLMMPVALPRIVQAAERVVAVNSLQFVDKGLVAVGRIPANQRDKFGETFGSGSGMSVERSTWRRTATGYQGNFVLLSEVFLRTTTRTGWLYVPPALRCISTRERVPILS